MKAKSDLYYPTKQLQEVLNSYNNDMKIQEVMQKVVLNKGTWDKFTLLDGLLRVK